ncbi:hypothetical protein TNCV_2895181 [Trichonephila clavipes]|nr:hypothetical protein TNCV_2895181 [Trichonephila clavipes]
MDEFFSSKEQKFYERGIMLLPERWRKQKTFHSTFFLNLTEAIDDDNKCDRLHLVEIADLFDTCAISIEIVNDLRPFHMRQLVSHRTEETDSRENYRLGLAYMEGVWKYLENRSLWFTLARLNTLKDLVEKLKGVLAWTGIWANSSRVSSRP